MKVRGYVIRKIYSLCKLSCLCLRQGNTISMYSDLSKLKKSDYFESCSGAKMHIEHLKKYSNCHYVVYAVTDDYRLIVER